LGLSVRLPIRVTVLSVAMASLLAGNRPVRVRVQGPGRGAEGEAGPHP
jgi:hypothetical protein